MEIETLKTLNEGAYPSQMMVIEITVLIITLFAIIGFAIYLASIAWLCLQETRQPTRPQMKP